MTFKGRCSQCKSQYWCMKAKDGRRICPFQDVDDEEKQENDGMTEKKCGKCIHFIQYVGDCTGECEEPEGKDGWIGTDTPSCDLFWSNTDICLICKHWIADKLHGKTWHYGKCEHSAGFSPRSCDSFCHRFERREDYKEYLQRLIEGKE